MTPGGWPEPQRRARPSPAEEVGPDGCLQRLLFPALEPVITGQELWNCWPDGPGPCFIHALCRPLPLYHFLRECAFLENWPRFPLPKGWKTQVIFGPHVWQCCDAGVS